MARFPHNYYPSSSSLSLFVTVDCVRPNNYYCPLVYHNYFVAISSQNKMLFLCTIIESTVYSYRMSALCYLLHKIGQRACSYACAYHIDFCACSFPRGGEQNEKMGFYCVSLLLLSCLLHLSLSTPIAIPPTVLYGPPGQCAADTANATDDTLARLGSLLRDRVIPNLNKRCSNEGYCEGNPAQSCRSIAIDNPEAASGEYWVRTCSGEAVRVYCDMTNRCCGGNGTSSEPGWMRVANRHDGPEPPVSSRDVFGSGRPKEALQATSS